MSTRSLTIAALLGASALFAQRYNFKFYGEEEGLESLAVQIVLQDRAGFLWVGTQNGLFRYDGNRFAGFGKADGLPDAHIESLHESIDGTLWVGTRFGLARRRQERFEKIPLGMTVGIVGREGIASDSAGNLYIATEHGLVAGTPSPKGLQFRLVSGTQPATSVYVDAKGRVWFGCGNGLCTLDEGQAHESGAESGLPPQRWDAILGDLEGNLWVRSEKFLYERSAGGRFLAHAGLPESSNSTPTLALDPAGRLLAPTYKGLARQTDNGWEVIGAKDGLTSNDISTVIQDREGSIWIGLLGSGLTRWLGYNEWQNWGEAEGLSRESTWSIIRDATGRLWVGSLFGLNYAENNGGKLVWRQQPLPGVDGFIRTMAEAPDGTLWIGTDPNGLLAMNRKTGVLKKIGEEQGLKNTRLRHVAVDHEGRIWAATYRGLFRSSAPDGARFEQVIPAGTDLAEMFHMTLADREGRIWVAGDRGLLRYSGDRWRRFTKQDGLAYDKVAQVVEDPDGSFWIGYRDAYGVTHLTFSDGEAVKMESYTQANGLRSDKTLFLQFDARGWLWVGTDHGVDVFDRARWRHYGRSDGLIWDDCNSNAFFADADGWVWVGTSRGLSRFRPAPTPAPNVPPPVVLTQVKLGGKAADPSHSLEMPYQENSLQVRFAALTFVQESSVLFRYRLDGGGTADWLETTQRELNYPQLPPGQYTLEVLARNAQGLWSGEPARLSFQVLPPWWLTWWFRLGTVVLALILGRLMWARRTHRLEAERYRLEKAVTDRTRELSKEKQKVVEEKVRAEQQNREIERLLKEAQQTSRLKSEFLANVSHEIRTPMNGILGMTDLVLTTPLTEEQRDYLDTARLSAHSLLTLLNDVLDFSKIEAGRLDLNPIDFSLRRCIRETSKMLRVGASKKGLVVECEVDDDVPDNVVGDPDRLRQVLYNIIGNAIKFTEQGGVYLSVSNEPSLGGVGMLRFTIRDTGIGIPQEKQQLIFEAFRQADGSTTRKYGGTGLGLAISSSLVEMMGGSIRVKSAIGVGSTFSFNTRFGLAAAASGAKPVDSVSLKNMLDAAGTDDGGAPPSLRILLAEDNLVNQRLAMRLLERRGHLVELASSGREAIEWLERKSFDLILMDLQMPDMDGIEATAIIREREKHGGQRTPIVALTAHTMKGDRERCLEAGMDNYINKPIDAVKFLEIVEMSAAPRV
jgi:signal transduction histidine kinase/ligand-binding sensor domain-containing protein/CheY-like chemotaxis protein